MQWRPQPLPGVADAPGAPSLPAAAASLVLALASLAIAGAVDRPWLRVVLGAAAATLLALAWVPWEGDRSEAGLVRFWMAWHLDLLLWLGVGLVVRSVLVDGARARLAAHPVDGRGPGPQQPGPGHGRVPPPRDVPQWPGRRHQAGSKTRSMERSSSPVVVQY